MKATFFICTHNVVNVDTSQPARDLVKRIVAEGHELASHTVAHLHLPAQTEAKIESELAGVEMTVASIFGPTGPKMTLFRAPYGEPYTSGIDKKVAPIGAKHGVHIGWAIDTLDWEKPNADAVYSSFTGLVKTPGMGAYGVVLMHSIHPQTAGALPRILDYLKTNKFEIKQVEDVVRARYGKSSAEILGVATPGTGGSGGATGGSTGSADAGAGGGSTGTGGAVAEDAGAGGSTGTGGSTSTGGFERRQHGRQHRHRRQGHRGLEAAATRAAPPAPAATARRRPAVRVAVAPTRAKAVVARTADGPRRVSGQCRWLARLSCSPGAAAVPDPTISGMDSNRPALATLAALLVVWWLHMRHFLQRLPDASPPTSTAPASPTAGCRATAWARSTSSSSPSCWR